LDRGSPFPQAIKWVASTQLGHYIDSEAVHVGVFTPKVNRMTALEIFRLEFGNRDAVCLQFG
jgi:hypothetical protein